METSTRIAPRAGGGRGPGHRCPDVAMRRMFQMHSSTGSLRPGQAQTPSLSARPAPDSSAPLSSTGTRGLQGPRSPGFHVSPLPWGRSPY